MQDETRAFAVGRLADGCTLAVRLTLRHQDGPGRRGIKPEAAPELSATFEERLPRKVHGETLHARGAGVPDLVAQLLAEHKTGSATLHAGWDAASLQRLAAIEEAWHMNHMRAGCIHQQAMGWSPCHGYHSPGLTCLEEPEPGAASPEAIAEARERATREGVAVVGKPGQRCALDAVGKPCPTCWYRYGSAWLAEPLPTDVLAWVRSVIATGRAPA